MSWWVAGVAVAGAASKFLGSQSQSRDMQEAARDSLLTGRYNVNQRKLESRQTQFAMLEQGHQAASNIQRSADQAVGTATASAGGSGAIVESGTPRAVLTNIAQEGLHAQMGAILNTKNAIKANVRQTEAMNKTEWNQANAYSKGMERDAKRTMDNARLNFAADTAAAIAGGYASSLGASSTIDKAVQVGKGAQHLRSSVTRKDEKDPSISKDIVKSKGYKNIHKKSKYSYGSYKSDRTFYGKGESPQSGKIPGGAIRGLRKQIGRDRQGPKEAGFRSNLMNFLRGTGWKGRASQKTFKY